MPTKPKQPFKEFDYRFSGGKQFITIQGEESDVDDLLFLPDDPDGIHEALAENASLYARWGLLMVDAEARVTSRKEDLKQIESAIDMEIREGTAHLEGRKKPTDPAIAAQVAADSRRTIVYGRYAEAVREYNMLKIMVSSWSERGYNAREMAKNVREEFKQEQ